MSQTIVDPRTQAPEPTRESASPGYVVLPDTPPAARRNRSNGLSIAAVVSALAGIVVATIPLMVSGIPRGPAIGVVSAGLVLGALAATLGAIGRRRAISKALGMGALLLGILSLVWTIGGVACTVW